MRISDWSSDVCSSDLDHQDGNPHHDPLRSTAPPGGVAESHQQKGDEDCYAHRSRFSCKSLPVNRRQATAARCGVVSRSEARREGKECVSTCRSRWSPYQYKKKKRHTQKKTNKRTNK